VGEIGLAKDPRSFFECEFDDIKTALQIERRIEPGVWTFVRYLGRSRPVFTVSNE
jgi:hypothetical protein